MAAAASSSGLTAASAAAAIGGAWGAGIGVMSAGFSAAAFIGGAMGSLASQAVGKMMGVVDDISLKDAFVSGATTWATAGLAKGLGVGKDAVSKSDWFVKQSANGKGIFNGYGIAAQAAGSYGANYAANKLVGNNNVSFSWKGMAAQVAGSVAGHGVSNNVDVGNGLVNGGISGFAAGATTAKLDHQWNGGQNANYAQVALNAFGNALGNSIVDGMSVETDLTPAEQKAINDKANKLINLDKLGNIDEPMAEIAKNTTAGAEKEATNSINKTGRAQRDKFDADIEVSQVVREQKAATYRENAVTRNAALADDLYSKQASTYTHQKDVAYEETQRKFRELGGAGGLTEIILSSGNKVLRPVTNYGGKPGPWSLDYLASEKAAIEHINGFKTNTFDPANKVTSILNNIVSGMQIWAGEGFSKIDFGSSYITLTKPANVTRLPGIPMYEPIDVELGRNLKFGSDTFGVAHARPQAVIDIAGATTDLTKKALSKIPGLGTAVTTAGVLTDVASGVSGDPKGFVRAANTTGWAVTDAVTTIGLVALAPAAPLVTLGVGAAYLTVRTLDAFNVPYTNLEELTERMIDWTN
ncbi:hypothetical protein [Catenovulum sediminis]|uniref:DUF637 domain-containing protein n=1 Tax=Catenovulum sediminis TaxID=1740262 RepID=A0ABV1RHY9_9ALTE